MRRPSLFSDAATPMERAGARSNRRDRGSNRASTRNSNGRDGNRNKNNSSRRINGTDGRDKLFTQTAILSTECQKRRFNPQFTEWSVQGKFFCSVNMNGIVLSSERGFTTANDAKQAMARRALEEIKKQPCASPAARAAAKAARAEQVANEPASNGDRIAFAGANRMSNPPAMLQHSENGEPSLQNFATGATSHHLAVQTGLPSYQPSPASTLSPDILTNPVASRAFLEGLALGARLYESAQRLKAENFLPRPLLGIPNGSMIRSGQETGRERERSPTTNGNRHVRERSPLRNQYRGP